MESVSLQDAEADAVNSDLESPGNDSKSSSLDRHSITVEHRLKDKEPVDQTAASSLLTMQMSDKVSFKIVPVCFLFDHRI